jgi:hypothetical protein
MLLDYRTNRSRPSAEARVFARDAGIAAFDNWPQSLADALDKVAAERDSFGRKAGLIGAYGWIHSEWAYLPPRTSLDCAVRDSLREHAVKHAIVPQREPLYGSPAGDHVTMTFAAKALRLDYMRARHLLDARGAVPDGVRRGVAFPIRNDDVAAALASRGRSSSASVRARLGVGKNQAKAVSTAFANNFPGGDWVEPFLGKCRGEFTPSSIPLARLVRLPSACRSVGVPIVEICKALVSGELAARGAIAGDPTLAGIMVNPAEVRRFAKRDWVSVEVAAAQLRLHHDAVRWLLRNGHLTRPSETRQAGVENSSVTRFASIYVPAAEVARSTGTSSTKIASRLREAGVLPAFGPPWCRQMIFARKDLLAAGEATSRTYH